VRTEQEDQNIRLVRRMYQEVLDRTDSSAVDAIFDPDYLQHNPNIATGSRSLKEMLDRARAKYPEVKHNVKRMIADGDLVAAHVHVVFEPGTPGFATVDIYRIKGDRIVEHWDVMQPVAQDPKNANGMF